MSEITDIAETGAVPEPPKALERGRYKLSEAPDGGWVVARAVGTCETCSNCGCGEQADLITVPGWVVALAKNGGGPMAMARALRRNGKADDGG